MANATLTHSVLRPLRLMVAVAFCAAFASVAALPAWTQEIPVIGDYAPVQTLSGEVEAALWVSGVTHPAGVAINAVEARITPPLLADGSDADARVSYHIARLDDMGGGLHVYTYAGFFEPGTYEIRLQVIDADGGRSDPVFTQVVQEAEELITDPFEPNDTAAEATWIGVNGINFTNNFHQEDDEDWFWFYVEDFLEEKPHRNEMRLQTPNILLGFGVDTLIQVYRDDGETLLFEHDDTSAEFEFFAHEVGSDFYFARVTSTGERAHGVQTNYDMRAWREQGMFVPGALTGVVTDADTGEPIEGANVSFPFYGTTAFGPLATDTDEDGFYIITPLVAGNYTIEAAAPGYEMESYDTAIDLGETVLENFAMTADGSGGEGEGEGPGPGCASGTGRAAATGRRAGDIGLALIVCLLLWAAKRPRTQ